MLEPDLDAATFAGSEEVALEVREVLDELVLNAADLEIDAGWVTGPAGARVRVADVRLDADTERAHLTLERALEPGTWTLHLGFRGTLNDRMRGFYRSTYTEDDGIEHVIATTQFESTDARRAFPCWDEPDLKAVFAVTLVVREGLLAISNEAGGLPRADAVDGRVRVRFADTMPMSTYLAAFVVGPLEATEPVDVDGVPLRIVHVPGKGESRRPSASRSAAFSLRFFADYYGIAYPGGKLDMVALPDFAQGAMENLGCITYREVALLAGPGEGHPAGAPERRRHRRARDRPHVVRRPRDDALVERDLAERGVRDVHGAASASTRSVPSGTDGPCTRARARSRSRSTRWVPRARSSTR